MPTEIEHGDRTHYLAVPFGADEAMREVGFAGGGTTGLRATDVHAKTLPRNPTGHNRVQKYYGSTFCRSNVSYRNFNELRCQWWGKSGKNEREGVKMG